MYDGLYDPHQRRVYQNITFSPGVAFDEMTGLYDWEISVFEDGDVDKVYPVNLISLVLGGHPILRSEQARALEIQGFKDQFPSTRIVTEKAIFQRYGDNYDALIVVMANRYPGTQLSGQASARIRNIEERQGLGIDRVFTAPLGEWEEVDNASSHRNASSGGTPLASLDEGMVGVSNTSSPSRSLWWIIAGIFTIGIAGSGALLWNTRRRKMAQ